MEDKLNKIIYLLQEFLEEYKRNNSTEKVTRQKVEKIFQPLEHTSTKEYYSFEEVKPLVDQIRKKDLNEAQTNFLEGVFSYAVKHGRISTKQYQSIQKML